jgi:hypothetical protein
MQRESDKKDGSLFSRKAKNKMFQLFFNSRQRFFVFGYQYKNHSKQLK